MKVRAMAKKSIKVCALMVLLPALILNRQKLMKGDSTKWKIVLTKYVKACLFMVIISTVPAILYCVQARYYKKADRLGSILCFLVGTFLAYLCEPTDRHRQYMGFLTPKAVEVLLCVLETRGILK